MSQEEMLGSALYHPIPSLILIQVDLGFKSSFIFQNIEVLLKHHSSTESPCFCGVSSENVLDWEWHKEGRMK